MVDQESHGNQLSDIICDEDIKEEPVDSWTDKIGQSRSHSSGSLSNFRGPLQGCAEAAQIKISKPLRPERYFAALTQRVKMCRESSVSEFPCGFQGCSYKFMKTSISLQTVESHILQHQNLLPFSCSSCKGDVQNREAHNEMHFCDLEPPQYYDMRIACQDELIDGLEQCFSLQLQSFTSIQSPNVVSSAESSIQSTLNLELESSDNCDEKATKGHSIEQAMQNALLGASTNHTEEKLICHNDNNTTSGTGDLASNEESLNIPHSAVKSSLPEPVDESSPPKCPDCNQAVMDDDRAIQCDICHDWIHQKCYGIYEEIMGLMEAYIQKQGPSYEFPWSCQDCSDYDNRDPNEQILWILDSEEKRDENERIDSGTSEEKRVGESVATKGSFMLSAIATEYAVKTESLNEISNSVGSTKIDKRNSPASKKTVEEIIEEAKFSLANWVQSGLQPTSNSETKPKIGIANENPNYSKGTRKNQNEGVSNSEMAIENRRQSKKIRKHVKFSEIEISGSTKDEMHDSFESTHTEITKPRKRRSDTSLGELESERRVRKKSKKESDLQSFLELLKDSAVFDDGIATSKNKNYEIETSVHGDHGNLLNEEEILGLPANSINSTEEEDSITDSMLLNQNISSDQLTTARGNISCFETGTPKTMGHNDFKELSLLDGSRTKRKVNTSLSTRFNAKFPDRPVRYLRALDKARRHCIKYDITTCAYSGCPTSLKLRNDALEPHLLAHLGKDGYQCETCGYKCRDIYRHYTIHKKTRNRGFVDLRSDFEKELVDILKICIPL